MRFNQTNSLKLLAVVTSVALLVVGLLKGSELPGERITRAQTATDLSENPPEITSLSATPLSAPTAQGNAKLFVRFAAGSNLGSQVTVVIDDRDVLLRDDGQGGDSASGDGKYTAVINLDFKQLADNQNRVSKNSVTFDSYDSMSVASADSFAIEEDAGGGGEYVPSEEEPPGEPEPEPISTTSDKEGSLDSLS